jgi:hypothetical protein
MRFIINKSESLHRFVINFDFGNKDYCIIFDHISQHRNFSKDNIVIYFFIIKYNDKLF